MKSENTELAEVLESTVDKFSSALADLGPDAARVWGDMVASTQIGATLWFWFASIVLCLALVFFVLGALLLFTDLSVEFGDSFAPAIFMGLILLSFFILLSVDSVVDNYKAMKYPEASLVRELIQQ